MNSFLIPANAKKSLLIFGWFNKVDAILFFSGIAVTVLLLLMLPNEVFVMDIIALSPALICTFLILPVPHYHNVRTVLGNAWEFYTTRQKYIWKGWCFERGEDGKK